MAPTKLQHYRDLVPRYGQAEQISPLVRRVLAENPNPFTYLGTGTYLVGNGDDVAVIDPGLNLGKHLDAIEAALAGQKLTRIIVTHTHADHSSAALPLQKRLGGVLMGYSAHLGPEHELKMEEGGDATFAPEIAVRDGDVINGKGWNLQVLHTPGHTGNHCCYRLLEEKLLFTGDHVMGWATTVVSPPDGEMVAYMAQLQRLMNDDDVAYIPTHGPMIPEPQNYVRALIRHREEREQQILTAIKAGAHTLPQMVAKIYTDVPIYLHPAAARSVYAHLIKLVADGRLHTTSGQVLESDRYLLTNR